MAKSTKPKSATSYKETAFGILPRSKIIPLEAEGIKKALHYIVRLSEEKAKITPDLIKDVHRERYITAMKTADQHDYFKLEKLIANALKESLENT